MGFWDWFRPRWRHSEVAVRREAIRNLRADQLAELAAVARQDSEPELRRLALERSTDVALLQERMEQEEDAQTRARARARLVELGVLAPPAPAPAPAPALAPAPLRLTKAPEAKPPAKHSLAAEYPDSPPKVVDSAPKPAERPEPRRARPERARLRALREKPAPPIPAAPKAPHRRSQAPALSEEERRARAEAEAWTAARAQETDRAGVVQAARAAQAAAERQASERKAKLERQAKEAAEKALHTAEQAAQREAQAEQTAAEAGSRQARAAEASAQRAEALARKASEQAAARQQREELRAWAALPAFTALLERADRVLEDPQTDGARAALFERTLRRSWLELGDPPAARAEELRIALQDRLRRLDGIAEAAEAARVAAGAEEAARRLATQEKNLEQKRAILAQIEAFALPTEAPGAQNTRAGDALKALQAAWKEAGEVPRAEVEPLRARYQAALDRAWGLIRKQRDTLDQARQEKRARLERIVEQAEGLVKATDPEAAAERAKGLQALWKSAQAGGPGLRAEGDALYARLRAASDAVFARRNEAFQSEQRANLAKKEAILLRAEAAADQGAGGDPEAAVRAIQQEWRRIGFVPQDQREGLEQRLRAACHRILHPPLDSGAMGQPEPLSFQPFAALRREDGEGS